MQPSIQFLHILSSRLALICVYSGSGAVSPSAGFPERGGVLPRPTGPGPEAPILGGSRALWIQQDAHTKEKKKKTDRRGKIASYCEFVMLAVSMHTHNSLSNLYILRVTIQGKGVGLQPWCAREEE